MYELTVQAEFAAAHSLVIAGRREPVHGHNWHITAVVRGTHLDGDGLLVDFHMVEGVLREIAAGFHNGNLNEHEAFRAGAGAGVNPSAENVARHIAEELSRRLAGRLPRGASVASIRITEAPGCAATFFPGGEKHEQA